VLFDVLIDSYPLKIWSLRESRCGSLSRKIEDVKWPRMN